MDVELPGPPDKAGDHFKRMGPFDIIVKDAKMRVLGRRKGWIT
jgi:hypothetical protein